MVHLNTTIEIEVPGGGTLTDDEKDFLMKFYEIYNSWASEDSDFKEGYNKHHQLIEFYYDDLKHDKVLNRFADKKIGITEKDCDTGDVVGQHQLDRMVGMITYEDDYTEQYENSAVYEYRNMIEEHDKNLKKRQKELKEHGDCVVFHMYGTETPPGMGAIRTQDIENTVINLKDDDGEMNTWELFTRSGDEVGMNFSISERFDEDVNIQNVTHIHFMLYNNRIMTSNNNSFAFAEIPASMLDNTDDNFGILPNVIRNLFVMAHKCENCRVTWSNDPSDSCDDSDDTSDY